MTASDRRKFIVWQRIAALALILAGGWYAVDVVRTNLATLPPGGLHVGWGALIAHLLAMAGFFAFQATAWRLMLNLFGPRASWAAASRTFFLGGLGRYLPGKVGGFVGRILVGTNVGLSRGQLTVAVCYEQAANMMIGLAALIAALAAVRPGTGSFREIGVGVTLTVAAAGLVILLAPGRLIRLLQMARVVSDLNMSHDTVRVTGKLRAILVLLLGWASYGAAGFFLLRAVGQEIALDRLAWVAAVFTGAWAAGLLTFVVPAGIGVREAALCFLLGTSVAGSVGGLVAVLSRLSWVLVELVWVGATVAIKRRPHPANTPDTDRTPGSGV